MADTQASEPNHPSPPAATETQVADLARAIAAQADAIATGRLVGPVHAAVLRLRENVSTLEAWARPSGEAVRA